MRVVLQRVAEAAVECRGGLSRDGREIDPDTTERASIGRGMLALVGFTRADAAPRAARMAPKIAHLRVFEDDSGRLNRSVVDIGGSVLLVPNFTLAGDCRHGRRPSFDDAMPAGEALGLFHSLADLLAAEGVRVERAVFRSTMRVALVNQGPVTLVIDEPDPRSDQ